MIMPGSLTQKKQKKNKKKKKHSTCKDILAKLYPHVQLPTIQLSNANKLIENKTPESVKA